MHTHNPSRIQNRLPDLHELILRQLALPHILLQIAQQPLQRLGLPIRLFIYARLSSMNVQPRRPRVTEERIELDGAFTKRREGSVRFCVFCGRKGRDRSGRRGEGSFASDAVWDVSRLGACLGVEFVHDAVQEPTIVFDEVPDGADRLVVERDAGFQPRSVPTVDGDLGGLPWDTRYARIHGRRFPKDLFTTRVRRGFDSPSPILTENILLATLTARFFCSPASSSTSSRASEGQTAGPKSPIGTCAPSKRFN